MSKFFVFKGSGGLGHMFQSIRRAIDYAKKTDRLLIIDTKNHKGFLHYFNEIFYIRNLKYEDNYNSIPKNYTWNGYNLGKLLKSDKVHIGPGQYTILGKKVSTVDLHSDDPICVFCGSGKGKQIKGLKIQNIILEVLYKEKKIPEKYIGIHYRNTDMKHDINKFISTAKKISNKTGITTIYLASDDHYAYDKFKEELPSNFKVIRRTFPPPDIKNLHYDESVDKFTQIYEALRDMYYILNSDYFIPSSKSSFSKLIKHNIKLGADNMFNIVPKTKTF